MKLTKHNKITVTFLQGYSEIWCFTNDNARNRYSHQPQPKAFIE